MRSSFLLCALVLLLTAGGCRSSQPVFSFRPLLPSPATGLVLPPVSAQPAEAPRVLLPLLRRPTAARALARTRRTAAGRLGQLPARQRPTISPLQTPLPPWHGSSNHPARDYTPLVLAVLLATLAILLLSASIIGLSGSYIPLIGVLILLLAGAVYFQWRRLG